MRAIGDIRASGGCGRIERDREWALNETMVDTSKRFDFHDKC